MIPFGEILREYGFNAFLVLVVVIQNKRSDNKVISKLIKVTLAGVQENARLSERLGSLETTTENGFEHVRGDLEDLKAWMERHGEKGVA